MHRRRLVTLPGKAIAPTRFCRPRRTASSKVFWFIRRKKSKRKIKLAKCTKPVMFLAPITADSLGTFPAFVVMLAVAIFTFIHEELKNQKNFW